MLERALSPPITLERALSPPIMLERAFGGAPQRPS